LSGPTVPLSIDAKVRQLFYASVNFHLGNGEKIKLWTDPWLMGISLENRAPALFDQCTRKKLSVGDALTDARWSRHFGRFLTDEFIIQFTEVWSLLSNIQISDDIPVSVSWRWTNDGIFSVKSAYAIQFEGAVRCCYKNIVWKSDATLRCKIFSWLAIRGRCLTADNLEKRG
jgi:hypothetical protein